MSTGSRGGKSSSAKPIIVGILLLLLVIVIVQNSADTKLHILFFNVTWPLWLLLTVFAVVAFAAGWFAGRTRR